MTSVRRRALLASLATLVLLGCTVTAGAGAAPMRPAAPANLCTTGKGVFRSLTKAPTAATLTTAQAQASLKTNMGKILAARGALVAAAPAKLKADVRHALAAYAALKAALAKVNYSFVALASHPQALRAVETTMTKAAPSFHRISKYADKTCKG